MQLDAVLFDRDCRVAEIDAVATREAAKLKELILYSRLGRFEDYEYA